MCIKGHFDFIDLHEKSYKICKDESFLNFWVAEWPMYLDWIFISGGIR